MSRRVPTAELRSGMTLAAPAHDRSGRLLIPAGMTLQEKHLRVLRAWGVSEVRIQNEDPPVTAPVADADAGAGADAADRMEPAADEGDPDAAEARLGAAADEALAERFQHCDIEHFPMDGIYRIARRALIDELRRSTGGFSQ